MSPAATWEALSTVFAGTKYLGIVRQDWSDVQWNLGSPLDAEVSRVQAMFERNDGSKRSFDGLPLSKT